MRSELSEWPELRRIGIQPELSNFYCRTRSAGYRSEARAPRDSVYAVGMAAVEWPSPAVAVRSSWRDPHRRQRRGRPLRVKEREPESARTFNAAIRAPSGEQRKQSLVPPPSGSARPCVATVGTPRGSAAPL